MTDESPYPREYHEFVRLFNERDFFEAHEVLEDLWVIEVDPLKTYYKGLIQAAVAICHWERGNTSGARKLYRSAMGYLQPAPARYEGLDVEGLKVALQELFAPLLANPHAPAPLPDVLPTLTLSTKAAPAPHDG
ncbi:hypothetical protein BH09SUM1_BH09SUM1_23030 [soil metagenome]